MKNILILFFLFFTLKIAASDSVKVDRTVLPIKDPYRKHITVQNARNVKAPKQFKVTAPKGAPNVVIIMLDDAGFGTASPFGGIADTPHMDNFAKEALLYNQFHTTSLCSPTRQALKTGRNHHTCNQAAITEMATSFPGYTGQLPTAVNSIATILNYNGYSTGAFGKWHETAVWETSISGPFDRWPNRQGFDEFYGFIGGETNQWRPSVFHNLNRVETPNNPEYHFMKDMTDRAVSWVNFQQAMTPDKPYFMYFTPGAVHAPHHVPESYIVKQKGKFDEGWDVIRDKIFEKQKQLGIIPQDAVLPPKPKDIKDWNSLSDQEKKLFARQAEVFAAFLEMTDYEIGRLLSKLPNPDNTLIFYITGDNGTSAEGGMDGLFNEYTYFNGANKFNTVDFMMKYYDKWGSPETYPHMAAGWAVAFDAPFKWTKQIASDYGGTRNGLMVKWPKGIKTKKEVRPQWHHIIDIAPTILEACNLPEPQLVHGIPQIPMAGVSMLYSFDNKDIASRRTLQYFEMMGNRGLYYDGWFAGTVHSIAWKQVPEAPIEEDKWFLYHVEEDFTMANDVADKYPERLKIMQDLFKNEAVKYNVYPLDDRKIERLNSKLAGRPDLMEGRKELTLLGGMTGLYGNNFLNIKNTSWEIEAEIEGKAKVTQGVILQQAGRFGGWSFYAHKGKLAYTYNFLGIQEFTTISKSSLPKGKATVKMEFNYDGKGRGKGGLATIYVNNKKVGSVKVPYTQAIAFSGDETVNVGLDLETMVSQNYTPESSKFNGEILYVTTKLK
ncbi:arylsulfatase [Flammeovirga kamogawensis]|uniref:Arylsulfatase n=1 Tax=Flammeovirga kamogawensis TaxID=373891 RepID=A0ABX8H467_9BACT|nr:arylsulfatase [Flammeovirga kamogawensis]MBB6463132.1 arylsulfatase [Flammeovirga kamogawensis]QWG10367.1 arylsulfatase [Flammeovirga kamogawensis]TRX63877.1 arylsulfatase [Flammeovirga kamogawensis]